MVWQLLFPKACFDDVMASVFMTGWQSKSATRQNGLKNAGTARTYQNAPWRPVYITSTNHALNTRVQCECHNMIFYDTTELHWPVCWSLLGKLNIELQSIKLLLYFSFPPHIHACCVVAWTLFAYTVWDVLKYLVFNYYNLFAVTGKLCGILHSWLEYHLRKKISRLA